MKTIFHIDDNAKWKLVVSNIKNLIKEYDNNNYQIIVLANSDAVKGYLFDDVVLEVVELSNNRQIKFKACNNALNKFNIDKTLLNNNIDIVSAGVYELTIRQQENYSYIKV